MIAIKFLGGGLLLLMALLLIIFTMRSQKKDWKMDESIHHSIGTQGYIFAATLLMIGVYLLITGINELNKSNENKTNKVNKVVIHRKH